MPRYPELRNAHWLRSLKAKAYTDEAIADLVGCSPTTVYRARRRQGVEVMWMITDEQGLEQALLGWVAEHHQTITAHSLRKTGAHGLRTAVYRRGGYPYWRNRLGQKLARERPTDRGRVFELAAFEALRARGFDAVRQAFRDPYDILVGQGIRVDVKGAKWRTFGYWFNFRILHCDVLMLGCEGESGIEWLIMPADAVGDRRGMSVQRSFGQWQAYHNAWHLLNPTQS